MTLPDRMKSFKVNVKGREWSQFISAPTAGKAKYRYLLGVRDAWPDTTFADLGIGPVYHPATVVGDGSVAWIRGAGSCHSLSHVEAA